MGFNRFNPKYVTSVRTGLLGWWPLNDLQDYSGNAQNLLIGTNPQVPVGSNISDKLALSFDHSVSDFVYAPDIVWPNPGIAISMSVWYWVAGAIVKPHTFSMGNPVSGSGGFRLSVDICSDDGNCYFDYGGASSGGGGRCQFTGVASYLSKWTHWAFVNSDPSGVGNGSIYANGVLVASDVGLGGTVNVLTGFYIGGWPNVGRFATAYMRDVRLYNRPLSTAEVQTIYAESFAPSVERGFWPGIDALSWVPSAIIYERPDSDNIDGTWTNEAGGASLFDHIDEINVDDADYIQSARAPSNDLCKISLSDASGIFPASVRYRYAKVGQTQIDLTIQLLEGTTVIATWTHTDISETLTTVQQDLTSPQFSSIGDLTNLYLSFKANQP